MGFPFKAVLKGLEQTATVLVPGAAPIDAAVHEVIQAKTGADREKAIIDSVMAGVNELEFFKPDAIEDPTLFNQGIVEAHDAFDKIQRSLKKPVTT